MFDARTVHVIELECEWPKVIVDQKMSDDLLFMSNIEERYNLLMSFTMLGKLSSE